VAHWLEEFGFDPTEALAARPQTSARQPSRQPASSSDHAVIRPRIPLASNQSANPLPKPIPSAVPQITDPFLIRAAHDPSTRLVLGELDMSRWLPPSGTPIRDPGPRQTERAPKNKVRSTRDKKSKG
jgi:hypothetical protein